MSKRDYATPYDYVMVKQRLKSDCAVACLAMLTGKGYADVLAAVGDAFDANHGLRDQHQAMKALGFNDAWHAGEPCGDYVIKNRGCLAPEFFRGYAWGRRALMTVPSLNVKGGWHMVWWDGRKLYDPSKQRTYEKWDELLPEVLTLFQEHQVPDEDGE